jgi:hypothetical protein
MRLASWLARPTTSATLRLPMYAHREGRIPDSKPDLLRSLVYLLTTLLTQRNRLIG